MFPGSLAESYLGNTFPPPIAQFSVSHESEFCLCDVKTFWHVIPTLFVNAALLKRHKSTEMET